MKNRIFLLLTLIALVFLGCGRKKEKMQFRFIGNIYNKNDSTPFANTKFKLYERWVNSNPPYKESPFTTDDAGHFDISNDGKMGNSPAWPSFYDGAAYMGPPLMRMDSITGSYNQDFENNVTTINFGNLYTTPYH